MVLNSVDLKTFDRSLNNFCTTVTVHMHEVFISTLLEKETHKTDVHKVLSYGGLNTSFFMTYNDDYFFKH